jgi:DNA relaxase NicK
VTFHCYSTRLQLHNVIWNISVSYLQQKSQRRRKWTMKYFRYEVHFFLKIIVINIFQTIIALDYLDWTGQMFYSDRFVSKHIAKIVQQERKNTVSDINSMIATNVPLCKPVTCGFKISTLVFKSFILSFYSSKQLLYLNVFCRYTT